MGNHPTRLSRAALPVEPVELALSVVTQDLQHP